MLLIVGIHTYIDGGVMGVPFPATPVGVFNFAVSELLNSVFYIAVNCYVLVTGYFLSVSEKFKLVKFEKIWLQSFFYLFFLTLVCYVAGIADTTLNDLAASAFVMGGNKNWFVRCYLGLLLTAPFLSALIARLDRSAYRRLLLVLTLLSVNLVKPLGFPFGDLFGSYGGGTLAWFVYLYMVAGYVRRYRPLPRVRSAVWGFVWCWLFLLAQLGYKIFQGYQITGQLTLANIGSYNGIVFPMSVCCFLFFRNCHFRSRHWQVCTALAPYVFGVFLLHEHFKFRELIWQQLNPVPLVGSPWLLPHIFGCVALLFSVGIGVDWLRARIVTALGLSRVLESVNRGAKALYLKIRHL